MKRAAPWLLIAALLLAGLAFWNQRATGPKLGAAPAAAKRADGSSALADAASSDVGVAAQRDTASRAATATARHTIRGVVHFAADGRPAADALVRAHRGQAPLARQSIERGLADARGSSRPAAAQHDLDSLGAMPWPEQDALPTEERDDTEERSDPTAQTRTDADGRFELPIADSIRLTIDAVAELAECVKPVVVDLGKEAEPAPIELLLIDGASVRGRVLDPDGVPFAGARVVAGTHFDPFAMFSAQGLDLRKPASAISDASGAFALAGVPGGLELHVAAHANGFASSPTVTVATVAGRTAEVELSLSRGATIAVTARDAVGAPVATALCRLERADLKLDEMTAQGDAVRGVRKRLDAEGQTRFVGIAAGRYYVRVDLPPWVECRREVVVDLSAPEIAVELQLAKGRELRGHVLAKDGTPIGGARVSASEPSSLANVMRAATGAGRRFAECDADGAFVLTGLVDFKLEVVARAAGYQEAKTEAAANATAVELRLATRGAIEGIALSRVTGKALKSFELRIERRAAEPTSMFDASSFQGLQQLALPFATENGKFRVAGVEPGDLRLTIAAEGHGDWRSEWFTLEEGATKRGVIASLQAEAVLLGRVVAAVDGRPVVGASVRQLQADQAMLQQMVSRMLQPVGAKSDGDGRFRIGGLGAGAHRIAVRAEGFVEVELTAPPLAAGETSAELQVELDAGAVIFGEVRGSDRAPIAGASIMCQDLTRFSMQSTKSDANGAYRIEGLAAGNFALTRMPSNLAIGGDDFMKEMQGQIETQSVRLKPGEQLRVDFGAQTQGHAALEGRVTSGGRPFAGAMVQVIGSGEEGRSSGVAAATTEADGSFRFDALQAGRAFVQVHGGDFAAGDMNAALVPVLLKEGSTVDVTIDVPAGALTGAVVDAESGVPLAGIAIYLAAATDGGSANAMEMAMRRTMAVRTNADGRFTLPRVPAGACRVIAGGGDLLSNRSRDHALAATPAQAPATGTVDLGEIRLPRAATIAGTLVDSAGKPVANGSLFLRNPASGGFLEEWSSVSSDSEGAFEYSGVPEGSWDVVARAAGHATATARAVRASVGQIARVRLELTGGTEVFALLGDIEFADLATLSLTIDGPQGPLPLTLFGLGELSEALNAPWQQNAVRLGRFAPGTYRVHGSLRGQPIDRSITLKGEPELRIPLSSP